jgi:hypothetical protein
MVTHGEEDRDSDLERHERTLNAGDTLYVDWVVDEKYVHFIMIT